MPEVKCSVSNCNYWQYGNSCGADVVMIDVDKHANLQYDTEFAGEGFETGHQDTVNKVRDTCCHTFKQKQRNLDFAGKLGLACYT